MHLVLKILGIALIVIAVVAKLGSKQQKWSATIVTIVVGIILFAIGSPSSSSTNAASASVSNNVSNSTVNSTQSAPPKTPQFVFTETGVLSSDYNQIIDAAHTGNFYTIKKALDSVQHDVNRAKQDVKNADTNLKNSGLPDLVTRYQQYLDTMSQVVKSGLAGNLDAEQKQLSDASDQGAYIATEMEVILGSKN